MKKLTILQLGDIHFPEHKNARIGDMKDRAAPRSVLDAIAPLQLELVMRKLGAVAKDSNACGMLVCGDLTTYGDMGEYAACVEYLNKSMQLDDVAIWPDSSFHVVPGNHDINRSLCDPAGEDLTTKFEPLVTTWNKLGRGDLLPIDGPRATALTSHGFSVSLYSLNSCIGCGERRRLPDKIQAQLTALFDSLIATAPPDDAFKLIGEQLDTPAFVDGHVQDLVASVKQLPGTSIPVILAHHNALPQSIPRVEIYTELINAGLFRSHLSSCNRTLIYCHGHIHTDPIEQIQDSRYPHSNVIFISAPLLVNGFNTLEFAFSRNDIPIGCTIHKYRISTHGSVDITGDVRIPLANRDSLSQFRDERLHALLKACNDEFLRFEQIRDKVRKTLNVRLNFDTLGDVIREAEWLSLVEVRDSNLECKHWKVRRNEP